MNRDKYQMSKRTESCPNSGNFPVRMPENAAAVSRNNFPEASSKPKDGMKMGRNEYPIPDMHKVRDMKERVSREGKPAELKFLVDMEA